MLHSWHYNMELSICFPIYSVLLSDFLCDWKKNESMWIGKILLILLHSNILFRTIALCKYYIRYSFGRSDLVSTIIGLLTFGIIVMITHQTECILHQHPISGSVLRTLTKTSDHGAFMGEWDLNCLTYQLTLPPSSRIHIKSFNSNPFLFHLMDYPLSYMPRLINYCYLNGLLKSKTWNCSIET